MKRVLIVCYWFPPSSHVPSLRAKSWFDSFPCEGLYPIVVTTDHSGIHSAHPTNALFRSHLPTHYQLPNVYYVPPFAPSPPWLPKHFLFFFKVFRRFLQYFEFFLSDYQGLYRAAMRLCQDGQIDAIVVTGDPFILFRMGNVLSRRFGIPWIADYRDVWTTRSATLGWSRPFILSFILTLVDKYFERRWLRSADLVTTVSQDHASEIGLALRRDVSVIENGYESDCYRALPSPVKFPKFTICYLGSIYPAQSLTTFHLGIKLLLASTPTVCENLSIRFIGIESFPGQVQRVLSLFSDLLDIVSISPRVPRAEAIDILGKSHLLLQVAYSGYTGVPSSKLYEYCASGTPVLLCPSDQSDMERIIRSTGSGYICNTPEQTKQLLALKYKEYSDCRYLSTDRNYQNLNALSRRSQSLAFARLIKKTLFAAN
jgi:glycosyltransferase involved in cell wall biosynthesis